MRVLGGNAGFDDPSSGGEATAAAVMARVRAASGTVVATGGCFDLLHAGHVRTLEAARALGDCLIVCLNSDDSVRRLKGRGRPFVRQRDRATVLEALACVDAVAIFDEPTPEAILERLQPDVWVKGGDYAAHELPEASVVARWGGKVVILPYVEGHSTTRLLEAIAVRGAASAARQRTKEAVVAKAERTAEVRWEGDLATGGGVASGGTGALGELPVSFPARVETPEGKTSPEELLAAAHASCYAMALSGALARAGTPPERLEVRATASLDEVGEGLKITMMDLDVRGRVQGLDAAAFQEAAEQAEKRCPVSNAIRGNVEITVHPQLLDR